MTNLLKVIALLACIGVSASRRIHHHDKASLKRARIDDILNEVDSVDENGTQDQSEGGVTEIFNAWVDELLHRFATNLDVKREEGEHIFMEAADAIIDELLKPAVTSALIDITYHQCREKSDKQMMLKFDNRTKCLYDLKSSLEKREGQFDKEGLTVRDQVTSQLTCQVLPEVLSCHEPIISHVVGCTGNGRAVNNAMSQLRSIFSDYCANNAARITDALEEAPSSCVPEGVSYAIKFNGPSFLSYLTAIYAEDYPCVYSRYIVKSLKIVLGRYCRAESTFLEKLQNIEEDFERDAVCASAR